MFHMEHIDSESPTDVMRWLQGEAAVLWPAFLGSLSLRRSRCVRPNCAACLSGEQHQSYVLYDRAEGRRIAVYVPEELVPQVQRGLDNGRALQDLLHQAAPRYIKALTRERTEAKKTDEGGAVSRTAERQVSFADWELMRQGLRLEPLLQAISDFLDDQKDMIEQVRCDLTRGLKKAETGRSGLTPQQILRSLILMRIKNWDYRELRERIADGCTLRQFTDFYCLPCAATRCVPPRLHSAYTRDAQGDQRSGGAGSGRPRTGGR